MPRPKKVITPIKIHYSHRKQLFWVTLLYTALFLTIILTGTVIFWEKPSFSIAYVPIDVLEWAFIGGMVNVLYRLAYYPSTLEKANFTGWIIAKPVIGIVMGGLVYFLAVSGAVFLNGTTQIRNTELLDVMAFIGGFSDKLSINLINRIVDKSLNGDGDDDNDKRKAVVKTVVSKEVQTSQEQST